MAKTNLNADNDVALRKGTSAVYRDEANRKFVQEQLKDENIKKATMDFIFGLSDENPIIRNKG